MKFCTLASLAWREIKGNAFRSWVVGLCSLVIVGLLLCTALLVRGSGDSLNLAVERLGADILVVPRGSDIEVQGAILIGSSVDSTMPASNVDLIRKIQGVKAASAQLYLESLSNASCCSASNMFVVAYDPSSDFTVGPWLANSVDGGLRLGDAVGGAYVSSTAANRGIKLYGYTLRLRANLERTGTNLDNSIFMTFATAQLVAKTSETKAQKPLKMSSSSVSCVLVEVASGNDVSQVASQILRAVPNVTAVQGSDMFGSFRDQLSSVREGMIVVLALVVVLGLVVMGFLFSLSVNERRRQIGVLQTLGADRRTVLFWLLAEAEGVALVGGIVGAVLAAASIYLFRTLLSHSLKFFVFPSGVFVAEVTIAGLVAVIICVALAAILPARRILRDEPATTMKE